MNFSPWKLDIICLWKILEKSLKFVCLKLYEPCPGTGFKCLARAKSPLQLFLSQEDGRKRNLVRGVVVIEGQRMYMDNDVFWRTPGTNSWGNYHLRRKIRNDSCKNDSNHVGFCPRRTSEGKDMYPSNLNVLIPELHFENSCWLSGGGTLFIHSVGVGRGFVVE